jgi:hypothetical protein
MKERLRGITITIYVEVVDLLRVSLIMNCLEYIYSSVLQTEKHLKEERRRQRERREESVKQENRECTENNRKAGNGIIEHKVTAADFAVVTARSLMRRQLDPSPPRPFSLPRSGL